MDGILVVPNFYFQVILLFLKKHVVYQFKNVNLWGIVALTFACLEQEYVIL